MLAIKLDDCFNFCAFCLFVGVFVTAIVGGV